MSLTHHRRVRAFIGLVAALAAGAAVAVAQLSEGRPIVPAQRTTLVIFAVLLVIGELRTLKWMKLHDGGEITTSWAFAFSILLLPAPLLALFAMALASTVGDLSHRKPVERAVFNLSQTALSLACAALVMLGFGQLDALVEHDRLGPLWFAAAMAACAVMFLVNGLLTCIVLALHEGTKVTAMLRRGLFLNLVSDGALVSLAPVFVVVATRSVLLLPLVVGVAGLVHVNTRSALASEHEANHDALTELWNRRAFVNRTEAELSERDRARGCALVIIDLDGFKGINDRLGHQVGDRVLVEVGRRLREAQRPGQIVARLGGDEFAVLITDGAGADEVTRWTDAVRESIARPCTDAGFPVSLTASIGIAMWPEHGADSDVLFQAADLAMYGAKKTGNAVQMYRENGSANATGRIALLSDLEAAIAAGQLTVWYQPQIDLLTGDVVALEALVRWEHPRLGLVMPGDFMPLAEQTDLMDPLTRRVLDVALRDAARWRAAFPSVRVAVNASARNLHDLTFAKAVEQALLDHRVPATALELEITENTVISQPERTRAVLDALGAIGVRLSIDDFGTGYSSLASLRTLPVQAIKIDRSFVKDLADDADDQAIVRGIVDLAHNLGLETVAEGVENSRSIDLLIGFGCNIMQGFLVERPMPYAAAREWLARRESERLAGDLVYAPRRLPTRQRESR